MKNYDNFLYTYISFHFFFSWRYGSQHLSEDLKMPKKCWQRALRPKIAWEKGQKYPKIEILQCSAVD